MSALSVAKALASRRLNIAAEREKVRLARADGFISADAVRNRAIRMIGILMNNLLTSGSASTGYNAAVAKLTAFNSEGAAVMGLLGDFETIDGLAVGYLAEIDALETVQDVIDWEAEPLSWDDE